MKNARDQITDLKGKLIGSNVPQSKRRVGNGSNVLIPSLFP